MEDRIRKAIKFFRYFNEKSNSDLYRKAVLRFCDIVEEYVRGVEVFTQDLKEEKNIADKAKEIFKKDEI
jgi:fructose-bisphosphate aldolase class 1